MLINTLKPLRFVAAVLLVASSAVAEEPVAYDLTARIEPGDAIKIDWSLKVGGELVTSDGKGAKANLPMSAVAHLAFEEHVLHSSAEGGRVTRALRLYDEATATIKVENEGEQRSLPERARLIVADAADGRFVLNGLDSPLNRDQLDLVRTVGDSMVLDRLLPNRRIAAGDGWQHDAEAIAALLGFDHVAMCDIRSTVVGSEHNQVKLTLAGTATGSVDGAATDVELRPAYLYHLDVGRITKFNLAIKERRKIGQATPGLNVVAKLSLTARPVDPSTAKFDEDDFQRASDWSTAEIRQLAFDSPHRGYRFRHDDHWYVTAVQPDLLSLRLLWEGDLVAHCNIRSLPARIAATAGEETLREFESDIRRALGDKLRDVSSATQWESPTGSQCFGVFADGEIDGVPMQWRYYLLVKQGKPQISISVTVEQSQLELFADADRPIIDSLELLEKPKSVASKPAPTSTEK